MRAAIAPPAWRRVRRRAARHRRTLAAGCAALAVWAGVEAVAPPPPPLVAVLAAARDLRAGTALAEADLRAVALPPDAVPDGALRPGAEVLGRLVAGPVRRGEPLTDTRLTGPALLARFGPGTVGVPVRLADRGVAPLVRPGDRVDLYALAAELGPAGEEPGEAGARLVASGVTVVTVLDEADAADGVLVVVAAPERSAPALAGAAVGGLLSVALRGGAP